MDTENGKSVTLAVVLTQLFLSRDVAARPLWMLNDEHLDQVLLAACPKRATAGAATPFLSASL